METYNFSHTSDTGITTSVSFCVPTQGLTVLAFHQLCKQAAAAMGFCEKNIEDAFGPSFDEAFEEFIQEVDE